MQIMWFCYAVSFSWCCPLLTPEITFQVRQFIPRSTLHEWVHFLVWIRFVQNTIQAKVLVHTFHTFVSCPFDRSGLRVLHAGWTVTEDTMMYHWMSGCSVFHGSTGVGGKNYDRILYAAFRVLQSFFSFGICGSRQLRGLVSSM